MKIINNAEDLTANGQLSAFLQGPQPVAFEVASDKNSRYQWAQRALVKCLYSDAKQTEQNPLAVLKRVLFEWRL